MEDFEEIRWWVRCEVTEAITIVWEREGRGLLVGEKTIKEGGGGAAAAGESKGAVYDASNVHELFGRRTDEERVTIGERKLQPRLHHMCTSPSSDMLTLAF